MGDSEAVVTETATAMMVNDYTSTEYTTTTDYNATNSNAVAEAGVTAGLNSVSETDGTYTAADGSTLGDGNAYNTDTNTVMQEAPVASTYDDTSATVAAAPDTSGIPVSHENSADTYDASVNGNGVDEVRTFTSMEHDVNGTALNDASGAAVEQQFDEGPAISSEEERLWSVVKANSLDFNSWIALIEETERVAEDNILKIRKIYDAFLAEFPLCYGYWKKYAEHETRLGSVEKVVEVFERAVEAVTYSVDMWLHYCVFAMSNYADPDKVRRLFERGLAYVGTDYLSYPLWDKYIEYEYSLQQWCHLAMIYTRILENPNQQLDRYFNSFKELAGSRPLSELWTAEESAAVAAAKLEVPKQGVESEVQPDGAHDSNPATTAISDTEELERYVATREEMYKKTKEFDSKIIAFETAIRRPYFHVRPLNSSELENWHNYLDFIERGDDFNKVVKLYERCLIACANYTEYWIRYVLCMEASGSIDLANNALARATQVFVKRQPEIHLFAARFREQNGDIPGARAAYQLVHSGLFPGLLEAVIKHANMEHRLGNMEDALSLYDQAIGTEKEKEKEQSQTLPMLFVQYARFQCLVAGNVEKAREILDGALEHVQLSKPFLEALIHLESVQLVPKRIDYMDSLVEKFITPNSDNPSTSSTDREDLSSIYLEFLDLFGDVQTVKKASDRHAKLFLIHKNTSELRKRSAEDFIASDKTKMTKSYATVPSTAQSVMGAYPSAQNQWAAGYGAQPQAWPQVQGQQYPGYAQQGAYGGYSGYSSMYTAPQVPVSTPQVAAAAAVAAYGAYPAQQPFAQQSYAQVQPTTAAFAPPPVQAQQPAPVSQSYYPNYY